MQCVRELRGGWLWRVGVIVFLSFWKHLIAVCVNDSERAAYTDLQISKLSFIRRLCNWDSASCSPFLQLEVDVCLHWPGLFFSLPYSFPNEVQSPVATQRFNLALFLTLSISQHHHHYPCSFFFFFAFCIIQSNAWYVRSRECDLEREAGKKRRMVMQGLWYSLLFPVDSQWNMALALWPVWFWLWPCNKRRRWDVQCAEHHLPSSGLWCALELEYYTCHLVICHFKTPAKWDTWGLKRNAYRYVVRGQQWMMRGNLRGEFLWPP